AGGVGAHRADREPAVAGLSSRHLKGDIVQGGPLGVGEGLDTKGHTPQQRGLLGWQRSIRLLEGRTIPDDRVLQTLDLTEAPGVSPDRLLSVPSDLLDDRGRARQGPGVDRTARGARDLFETKPGKARHGVSFRSIGRRLTLFARRSSTASMSASRTPDAAALASVK